MSCYGWERAEVLLPAAEVARVKKAVRDAFNNQRRVMLDVAERFWVDYAKKTRSPKLYRERLDEWVHTTRLVWPHGRFYSPVRRHISGMDDIELWQLHGLLNELADKPAKLKSAAVERYYPKVTNRVTEFKDGSNLISFDGRRVTWEVPENNHALDRCRDSAVAAAFFAALDNVKWTRGTGGELWSETEYSRHEARMNGVSSIYHDRAWGPLGKAARERRGDPEMVEVAGQRMFYWR